MNLYLYTQNEYGTILCYIMSCWTLSTLLDSVLMEYFLNLHNNFKLRLIDFLVHKHCPQLKLIL